MNKIIDFIGHAPPAMKASMALDLERGNRLELPWLGGKVVAMGRELGVPTPTHGMTVRAAEALHHGHAGLRGRVGWVERSDTHHFHAFGFDGYRFAPPILRTTDCPTGKSPQDVGPALHAKIFRLRRRANQLYNSRHPVPQRGVGHRRKRGAGSGGREGSRRRTAAVAYGEIVRARRPRCWRQSMVARKPVTRTTTYEP